MSWNALSVPLPDSLIVDSVKSAACSFQIDSRLPQLIQAISDEGYVCSELWSKENMQEQVMDGLAAASGTKVAFWKLVRSKIWDKQKGPEPEKTNRGVKYEQFEGNSVWVPFWNTSASLPLIENMHDPGHYSRDLSNAMSVNIPILVMAQSEENANGNLVNMSVESQAWNTLFDYLGRHFSSMLGLPALKSFFVFECRSSTPDKITCMTPEFILAQVITAKCKELQVELLNLVLSDTDLRVPLVRVEEFHSHVKKRLKRVVNNLKAKLKNMGVAAIENYQESGEEPRVSLDSWDQSRSNSAAKTRSSSKRKEELMLSSHEDKRPKRLSFTVPDLSVPLSDLCLPLLSQDHRPDLNEFDNFIFDMDGVLWKGNMLIDGADKCIFALRQMGKQIIFVTNNSSKSRNDCLKKLSDFNITAFENEIFSSSFAAAYYLSSKGFSKTVFTLGEPGIGHEMDSCNLRHIDAYSKFGTNILSFQEHENLQADPSIGAVVVGIDPKFTYTKLAYALQCLKDENCLFIATNMDNSFPCATGILPGGGSIVAAVATACGRHPIVMGKPEPMLLNLVVERFQLDRRRTLMIGDKLETDILFGKNGGLKALLVLSGVSSREDVSKTGIIPDFILNSIKDMIP